MVDGFNEDLERGKYAENIVTMVMTEMFAGKGIEFTNVSDVKEHWHDGDIEIRVPGHDKPQYMDVKDDGVWAKSGNLLAEDRVWFAKGGNVPGFMRTAKYDLVAYHSRELSKFLIINFKKWRDCYRQSCNGRRMHKKHVRNGRIAQTTYGYLNPIERMIDEGVVLAEIDYDYSGTYENPTSAWIVGCKNYKRMKKTA